MGRPSEFKDSIARIYWMSRFPNESREAFEARRRTMVENYPYATYYVMRSA